MSTAMRYVLFLLLLLASGHVGAQNLVTIKEYGPRSQRLNLVMLSEGYTASELAANKFKNDATTISNALLTTEPFKTYRPFFNVYGIAVPSTQSGADEGSAGGNVSTYFNATFNSYGIDRLLTIDSTGYSRAYSLLNTYLPDYDIVLVIVNDSKYGGSGGSFAVTSTNTNAPDIAIHEIGHSFAGLGDEYDYAGSSPSEDPNTTQQTNRTLIKWKHWINAGTPIPTSETSTYGNGLVGLFEGAAYNATDWYRPTLESKMKSLGEPFYAVNEEAIVLSIYSRVSPITSFSPVSTTVSVTQPAQTMTFIVDGPSKAGTDPAIAVRWTLDGSVISGQSGRTLTQMSTTVGNGSHTLIARVDDPTLKVRADPSNLLSDSHTWTLNLSNQGPAAPSQLAATANADGSISLTWTDNSTDDAGFAIERAVGTAAYAEIGRVVTNVTSYTDSSTTPGASTKYRVKGVNEANTTLLGLASNIVTVMPSIAPTPVADPQPLTVNKGQSASFTVQASGIPLRYQWRLGGNNVAGATKATYTIASAQGTHAGSYDCVVSNDVGSYTSGAALLIVNLPAYVIASPVSLTVFDTQPTTFSVQAGGTPTLSFQWRKNTIDIVGANTASLILASPDSSDAASYDCRITNAFGSALSKAAVLTVLGKPVILSPPSPQTVTLGQTASFSVTAKGTGTLLYQWRKSGAPLSGATKATFSLVSVHESELGSYDCLVSNSYGAAPSSAAALSLNALPTSDARLVGARAGQVKWRWTQRLGGTGYETADGLAIAEGKLLAAGISASPSAKFGSKTVAFPIQTGWSGRFSLTSGAAEWVTNLYPQSNYIWTVAGDGAGHVLVGGGTPAPSGRVWIRQSLATGNVTESYSTTAYSDTVESIAAGPSGSVYYLRLNGTHDALVKANSDGTIVWERQLQAASIATRAMHIGANGLIYIGGYGMTSPLSFDNPSPMPASSVPFSAGPTETKGFVVAYDDSGTVQWTALAGSDVRSINSAGSDSIVCAVQETTPATVASAVVLNATTGAQTARVAVPSLSIESATASLGGELALLMYRDSSFNIGNYTSPGSGYALAKYSSAGDLLWVQPVLGARPTNTRPKLLTQADGTCYLSLTMHAVTNTDFGTVKPFTNPDTNPDALLACLIESPVIVAPPASQIIALGDDLHLSIDVGGQVGSVSYQWLKEGKLLKGQTAATFDVGITTLANAGSYSCKVTSAGGSVESARAIVNIVDTPPRTLKAPLNKPLDLPVIAAGPGLSYIWERASSRLYNSGGFTNSSTSKLHLTTMTPAFADNYLCHVTGLGGTVDVPFTTNVMERPVFASVSVPASVVSGDFDLQLSASDAASYKISKLPAGLVFNSKTGRITGKPTTPGSRMVTVIATNAVGSSLVALSFTIVVEDIATYAKGNFQALIARQPWNADLGGLLTVALSSSGAATGSLRIAGASYALSGRVSSDASTHHWTFDQRITRKGKAALLIQFDSPTAIDGELTGSISVEAFIPELASVSGRQRVWSAIRPASSNAGIFNATLTLPPALIGDISIPQGPASMKTTVTASTGLAAWSGKLGDGIAFTGSSYLWPNGEMPTWLALYSNTGSLFGKPLLTSPTQSGTLEWTRHAKGTSPTWTPVELRVSGSKAGQ